MSAPQVAAALLQLTDRLTASVLDEIWRSLPDYRGHLVLRDEVERFARPHITIVLEALAQRRRPDVGQLQFAVHLGASRALQGVPLDAVIQAFRIAERVLVNAFMERGDDLGGNELRAGVNLLATAFDDLTQAAIGAYRQAQSEITVHYQRLESDLVGQLATTESAPAHDVGRHARAVGAEPDAPHQAVALAVASAEPEAMLTVRRHVLANAGALVSGRILSGAVGPLGLLLLPYEYRPERLHGALSRALTRPELHEPAVAGVGDPAPGLAEVGASCRQALSAAEVGHRLGRRRAVVRYEEVLLEVLLARDPAAGRRLSLSRLAPLLSRPHLLATLRTYLDRDLSQRATAEALILHPNTVAYRLRRVEQLTGRSLRRLPDLVELSVALRALDLEPPGHGGEV